MGLLKLDLVSWQKNYFILLFLEKSCTKLCSLKKYSTSGSLMSKINNTGSCIDLWWTQPDTWHCVTDHSLQSPAVHPVLNPPHHSLIQLVVSRSQKTAFTVELSMIWTVEENLLQHFNLKLTRSSEHKSIPFWNQTKVIKFNEWHVSFYSEKFYK